MKAIEQFEIPEHVEDREFEDLFTMITLELIVNPTPENLLLLGEFRNYCFFTDEGFQTMIDWLSGYEPSFQGCYDYILRKIKTTT